MESFKTENVFFFVFRRTKFAARGIGGSPPTSRKGPKARAPKGLSGDPDIRVHTCKGTQISQRTNKTNPQKPNLYENHQIPTAQTSNPLERNSMNKTQNTQVQLNKISIGLNIIMLSALTSAVFVGCTSSSKRKSVSDVIRQQNVTLVKLKKERNDPRVKTKIKSDPDLLKAERHLSDTIRALYHSNKEIWSALNPPTPAPEDRHHVGSRRF